jgi:hypothetical protein
MAQYTFETPFLGVQYANWFGEKVLVPFNIVGALSFKYGQDFMTPHSKGEYTASLSRQMDGLLDKYLQDTRYLSGHLISSHELCCPSKPCDSLLGRWHQMLLMLQFFHQHAVSQGYEYTVSCDVLAYQAQLTKKLPTFVSIAVRQADRDVWRNFLRDVTRRTTYVIEKHSDGSWLHMRFSKNSTSRLVLHYIPDHIQLYASLGAFKIPGGTSIKLFVHKTSNKTVVNTLIGLCDACSLCHGAEELQMKAGVLRNKKTNYCVTLKTPKSGGYRVRLSECERMVCGLIFEPLTLILT